LSENFNKKPRNLFDAVHYAHRYVRSSNACFTAVKSLPLLRRRYRSGRDRAPHTLRLRVDRDLRPDLYCEKAD
jgi:hypothetical protein